MPAVLCVATSALPASAAENVASCDSRSAPSPGSARMHQKRDQLRPESMTQDPQDTMKLLTYR